MLKRHQFFPINSRRENWDW